MKEGLIALLCFLIFTLISHYVKKYFDKLLIIQKERYQAILKNNVPHNKMRYNVEKAKVEYLEVYSKGLGIFKWFCVLAGIFALIRSNFPQYFE